MKNNTEPEYITIGMIVSPWGLQGHIKVTVETDFPQRFNDSSQVYIDNRPIVIEDATWHKGQVILKLHGVDTEDEANELIGHVIEIHHSQLHNLEDGEYFHFQLIDLEVVTGDGDVVGKISEILSIASADVYVIRGESGEIMIPATDEVIKSIDLEKGIMVIEPMSGLLDLNRKKTKR
ncbi:MAG: 16S rRNA processing protein RimM [Dehalococcoidales bacterium]|nr:MAG: 16S rRNA processing protein RimM [Dehalococcoidales bacterium]